MSIHIRNIRKSFGAFEALRDVSLEVGTGELVALLGPSGSGKTTLLRTIAGLETPTSGAISLAGEDASSRSVRERGVGFVFQHYALFRHMTVFENVAFGLRVRPRKTRPSRAEIREKVTELLSLVQLEGLSDRHPAELSGGQRQRVALARALAVEPKVLLLDEPFGALDARVRQDLRRWLRRLHDELHITSVFVTHDQEEAMEVADRIVVMNKGRVEQIGTPEDVYAHPANPFVYQFLGNVNLFHGRVHEGQASLGDVDIAAPQYAGVQDTAAVGYARPHDLDIALSRNGTAAVEAVVRHIHAVGPVVRLELARTDTAGALEVEIGRERYEELGVRTGATVYVTPRRVQVYIEDYVI
ncbi:MAG TPA: sulfate ABC transporter ATP-binding protein [Armatimonadota bacterium]